MALKTIGKLFRGWLGVSEATNAYAGSRSDEQYPARPQLALDQKDMLGRMQHLELLNSGRHIFNSYPMVSGAINDMANHAVGSSWNPQYKGRFPEFARPAEEWLREWGKICDVRGHPFSLTTDMYVAVVTLCRDGEFFYHLTSNSNGYPLVQFVESHRVGSRGGFDGLIPTGPYEGMAQRNGIAYNEYSRPVAYHYLADDPKDDQWIPADRLRHCYDPKWFSQGRGISPLVYGILDWLDVHGWRQNEKIAQLIFSSIALIEANEEGAPSPLQQRMKEIAGSAGSDTGKPKNLVETFTAGMSRFIKINGSNIQALKADRPSAQQADFEERILRGCFRALGWTYEQAYKSDKQGGANVRRDVAQNQKSIEHIQEIISTPWIQIEVYALSAGASLDILYTREGIKFTLPVDYYLLRPQLPQKMTVDHGRDRRVDIEEIRAGTRTMIQDIRDQGGDEETHLLEQVAYYKMQRAVALEANIPREEWAECFGTRLINQPSAQPEKADAEDDPEAKKTSEESDDESTK